MPDGRITIHAEIACIPLLGNELLFVINSHCKLMLDNCLVNLTPLLLYTGEFRTAK